MTMDEVEKFLKFVHYDWLSKSEAIVVYMLKFAASRVRALEAENAELRSSLEHLEKLASTRIDEERKTSRIPPPEHVDD